MSSMDLQLVLARRGEVRCRSASRAIRTVVLRNTFEDQVYRKSMDEAGRCRIERSFRLEGVQGVLLFVCFDC